MYAYLVFWHEEVGPQVFLAQSWMALGAKLDAENRIGGVRMIKALGRVKQ